MSGFEKTASGDFDTLEPGLMWVRLTDGTRSVRRIVGCEATGSGPPMDIPETYPGEIAEWVMGDAEPVIVRGGL